MAYTMGTRITLTAEAPTRAAGLDALEGALRLIDDAEGFLSTWRSDTALARLSVTASGDVVQVAPRLDAFLREALACERRTGGSFSLGPTGAGPSVAPEGAGRYRRVGTAPLDSGGFGKGAALDDALRHLREAGLPSARLDFGGQIAAFSETPAAPVQIDLAHPHQRERALLRVTRAASKRGWSLATSGNSERGAHLLDPRRGAPAADFGSLSVLAESALLADCLSTGLFVAGPDAALEAATRSGDFDVIAIEVQGDSLRVRASSSLRGQLELLEEDVALVFHRRPVDGADQALSDRSQGAPRCASVECGATGPTGERGNPPHLDRRREPSAQGE